METYPWKGAYQSKLTDDEFKKEHYSGVEGLHDSCTRIACA